MTARKLKMYQKLLPMENLLLNTLKKYSIGYGHHLVLVT